MSFKKLGTLTRDLHFADTDRIFALGKAAYMAMFTRTANPFKSDRDRTIWDKGYAEAQDQFMTMIKRWRELDKGAHA